MEAKNNTGNLAQGAEPLNESELHEKIMQELADIHSISNGSYYRVKALTDERALFIARRGNFDEIMSMIHNYGKTIFYPQPNENYVVVENAILPETVQLIIAESNNSSLINAYISYWGFDKLAQEVIIERGNHDELMHYIERHGFQPKQQRLLLARGNEEEINLHIQKHGLAEDIVDEIFTRIIYSNRTAVNEFYRYINHRELSIELQKRMIATVSTNEFKAYVNKYGLWNQTHKELVNNRSIAEINYYLGIHKYLYYDAEAIYLKKAGRQDRFRYVENKPGSLGLTFNNLINEDVLDYELLNTLFTIYTYDNEGIEKAKKIKDMSHEDVMKYIQKEDYFSMREKSAIFFRNNQEEFEALVKKMLKK